MVHYYISETNLFAFTTEHARNIQGRREFKFSDAFEAFLEMWLNPIWILCFGKDLKHFVVGQKEESMTNRERYLW